MKIVVKLQMERSYEWGGFFFLLCSQLFRLIVFPKGLKKKKIRNINGDYKLVYPRFRFLGGKDKMGIGIKILEWEWNFGWFLVFRGSCPSFTTQFELSDQDI